MDAPVLPMGELTQNNEDKHRMTTSRRIAPASTRSTKPQRASGDADAQDQKSRSMLPFPPQPTNKRPAVPSYHRAPTPPRRIFLTARSRPTSHPPRPAHTAAPHLTYLHCTERAAASPFYITTGRGPRELSPALLLVLVRCHAGADQSSAAQRRISLVARSNAPPPLSPSPPSRRARVEARRHGAAPRRPAPRPRRVPRVRARRLGREGAQGRVLRADVPPRGGDRAARHGPRPRARGPQRRLRHAPPVPRLLRQRMRRVGADGRDADDCGGEGGALQHQLPPLLRGRGRGQERPRGAVPRRRLLRRHHHHGRPRRRRADWWTQLGREAWARGQSDGEPGGLGQHHAEPARQREHAHPPLRRVQAHRHRPRRALRLALRRRGPLLLHRLPPLQPVRLRPPRPPHGPGLPPSARRALPPDGRPERHRRHGRHPGRLRQPVLQGPGPPPRVPELRPDALLRQRRHPAAGDAVQREPGRLLQGLHRGDGQDGRAPEPQEGGDSAQLPRRQRRATSAGEAGRAVPGAGLLNLILR